MNETIKQVTERIQKRSAESRSIYLKRIEAAKGHGVNRNKLGCSNLAHAMAPMEEDEKASLSQMQTPNIAIVTAYNDMLSAHEPYKLYPSLIKRTLMDAGATCQVAGGVPAMCDGVRHRLVRKHQKYVIADLLSSQFHYLGQRMLS